MAEDRSEQSKGLVRRMVDAINQRDLAELDSIVAPDLHRHSGATSGVTIENRDQFKAFLEQDFAAVPDSVQQLDFLLARDDFVAIRARYMGTQRGPWGPFPPSNKRLELPFIGIVRVEDGRIAEIWVEWDNLNALQQLGHLPSAGTP